MSWCSSCCRNCFAYPPANVSAEPPTQWPFSFGNLLAVGTVAVCIAAESLHRICDHRHAEDGWHPLQGGTMIAYLSDPEDVLLYQELQFLLKNRFLSATYRFSEDGFALIRIYLIPHDLPNVQGKLKMRKETILAPARRYLRRLLLRVSANSGKWEGVNNAVETQKLLLPDLKDPRSLADIYGDLVSPQVEVAPGPSSGLVSRLVDFNDPLEDLGMRSKLYKYQRRSVAAMIQKEQDIRGIPDPLFIPLLTMDNKQFYLQPGTMEVLQDRPMTVPCRGGILCEELGTGKTVMILTLIMATRNQISSPEPSIIDERPIMTPLSFRHFPSGEYAIARKRFFRSKAPNETTTTVPSLVELLLHRNRTAPPSIYPPNAPSRWQERLTQISDQIQILPLGGMLRANGPWYHHYLNEPSNQERARRHNNNIGPRKMYLSSASLIVVPPNLLSQWDQEIMKHCSVPLRVLVMRTKTPMPSIQSLASDYDIILMTYTRFTAEANANDVIKLHSWAPCKCSASTTSRIPECKCVIFAVSLLLQIRWMRLVIDEGHVSASLSTLLVPFAKLLSVERRWIVTGTPTTNLLGLNFGSTASKEVAGSQTPDIGMSALSTPEPDIAMAGSQTPTSSHSPSKSPPPPDIAVRVWSKYDRGDLNKLGNMITHFIAVPQFNADTKLMSTHVTEPLLDPSGPRPGAIQVLNQMMEMVMIRHRIEEVEKDVVLPPVTQENILLDLDPFVIKSFNAMQAGIVVNAVDSERVGPDYLFHPRNAEHLQLTVKNMSQLLFWFVDSHLYNSHDQVVDTEKYIDRAIKRNRPQEEIEALRKALQHLRIAAEDEVWRQIQTHVDVPYRVYDMKEQVFNAWTRTPGHKLPDDPTQTGLLHADRLLKIYDMAIERPLITEKDMVDMGTTVATQDHLVQTAFEEAQRRKSRGRKAAKRDEDLTSSSQMAGAFAKKASAVDTLKEMQQELGVAMAKLGREEDDEGDSPGFSLPGASSQNLQPQPKGPSRLVASSPLAKVRVGSSASSKLNYIINEVQQHSATEKFLIFSESPLTLAHVAEALDLTHVKFLRYTTQVAAQVREQLVLTFETSETYRVFLMELKHGARGLNLISASRVIFCEPVWQADVESQAIKRVHRIGQTRPITVKTLAIRSTAEENMVERRSILRNTQEKLPKLVDEKGMRHYIANPKFIEDSPSILPTINFPLLPLPPEILEPSPPGAIMLKIPVLPKTPLSLKRVRVEDPVCNDDPPTPTPTRSQLEEPPTKKKKGLTIRFDDISEC